VAKGKGRPVKPSIAKLLQAEDDFGLSRPECYAGFRALAEKVKLDLLNLALELQGEGPELRRQLMPGRCSTLLNYVGIDRTLMPIFVSSRRHSSLVVSAGQAYSSGRQRAPHSRAAGLRGVARLALWRAHRGATSGKGLKSKLVMPMPELRILSI
jgi:hypothetical protein